MSRLRVAVVAPEVHRQGGTERSLAEQLERWNDRFDIVLYTMKARDVDLSRVQVRMIWPAPGPHLLRYLWWFTANQCVQGWDTLWGRGPDVVHSTGVNCLNANAMSVHIVFAKYRERVRARVLRSLLDPRRALVTLHRVAFWGLLRVLERRVYSGPATLWTASENTAREIETRFGRPRGAVACLPHGVDTSNFSPPRVATAGVEATSELARDSRRTLLLVGNDWENKGLPAAIRALTLLPSSIRLAVAGRDNQQPYRAQADRLGVDDRVVFLPITDDVVRYYAAADCLVAPSREDSFHLPALEAMACGIPVIVSSKAGVSELVEDGRHALVLEDPEDHVTLARLIRRVFEEPGLAERLGREGRALAERCSWEVNAERAAALIEREATTPRVMVLAPDPWGTGGIERASRTLIRALSELYGAERVGLIPVWGPPPGTEDLPCRVLWRPGARARPGRSERVGLRRMAGAAVAAMLAARRWRGRQLVIVACHPHLARLARACGALSGAPVIVWCHGFEVWSRIRSDVARALRGVDLVFGASRFTAERVVEATGVGPERVRVLPHALPPELEWSSLPERQCLRVLTVARLDPAHAYKGVDTLLIAWPNVAKITPGAELVIVGDGADRPRLETIAQSNGGNVRFLGPVPDAELRGLYAESTVFCLPGRATLNGQPLGEGFGLVFLEAAAAGLPVVAGRAGGAVEAVVDGVTGLLVDPESPDAVAAALVRLLGDPALATRMGNAGREFVAREFSFERFRTNVADAVQSVLAAKRAARP